MEVFTIGFTQSAAARFFGRLTNANIERLLDVRLRNASQLAGFAKRGDLAYFLHALCGASYIHELSLAPTQALLDTYKKRGNWEDYEQRFLALLAERRVEDTLDRDGFAAKTVLLCSEPGPERCHRRLVAEYLASHWGDVTVVHL